MKKILLLCLVSVFSFGAVAQTSSTALDMIKIKPNVPPDDYSPEIQKALFNKILQLLTQKGTGSVDSRYALEPLITVLTNDVTSTAPPKYIFTGELSLYVWDLQDKSVIHEVTIPIKGVDASKERAMLMAVNQFNPRSPLARKFITDARTRIDEYYTNNIGTILKQAEVAIMQENYDEANAILYSIPVGTPAFNQSADAIMALYALMAQYNCSSLLGMAQRCFDVGEYSVAKTVISKINPGSACDADVTKLLKQIADKEASEPKAADAPKPAAAENR